MARKNTIRLLLVNASDNDSELMVSLFRSAGRVARAQRINSADEFARALQQPWDLLIADDNHPELKVEACLDHLRKAKIDFPILVLRDTAEISPLFAAGARDVIGPADEQRLICAALREIENIDMRRSVAKLQQRIDEAEQRNALLLGEADQAIAYVTDGMVIGTNALFAERFGFDSEDELDCMPIVDLLTAADQDGFKTALKNGAEAEFNCTGQRIDGEKFSAHIRLLNSNYDGDPCTQLIVSNQACATASAGDSERDTDTGLFTRNYLFEQLPKRSNGWLLYIGIDKFVELRRELGFNTSVALVSAVTDFLTAANPFEHSLLARVADGGFALLVDGGDEKSVLERAQQLCSGVAGHAFDPALTVSIGVTALGRDDAATLLDNAFNAAEKARANSNGEHIHLHRNSARGQQIKRATAEPEHVLDDALEEQRFALLYQPIISLRGAAGEHYEVLLRMRGATDALELPDNFIESLGVSANNAKLDRWILLEATKQLAENRAGSNDTRLLINLTANALQDESLGTWLGVALKATGLPPASLILQLRETDVINDLKAAKVFSDAIHQLGCRLSISDFGRVPESKKTLKALAANMVQIDGSFTRTLHTNGDAQPLKTLVAEVGTAGVKTIVPYVENASVLATLWQVGADFIQGHYLQAPSREMNYEFTDIA
ncbi:MAG TPA: bifunctional diguanylate cyclase/phosphodiesterase [Spongiibacteraceae bacterium]|jgi:EAL domain-containing protein (putative c-di-GMP-specific phosphodiesterase class I)/CheY-like chemotaxis protein